MKTLRALQKVVKMHFINMMLREMLATREARISSEKNAVGEEEIAKAEKRMAGKREKEKNGEKNGVSEGQQKTKRPSRYISVKVRKILKQEHGDKCSIPHCNKTAKQIHHTQRFALAGAHDPRYMAPLCAEHHKIAHAIDQKVQDARMGG